MGMDRTSLGNRMKGYESVSKRKLIRRMPVILRIDGKAFHTYTKPLKDPFNSDMHNLMVDTTNYLVNNIQNAMIGYTQSDEISILLKDWTTHTTEQWFDGKQDKMVSVGASMTTGIFNHLKHTSGVLPEVKVDFAMFDCRAFNVPPDDVCNYFLWRQQDATRNSVQMLGHHHMSQKQMHGKNNNQVQELLLTKHDINWNDLDTWKKRGTCVIREDSNVNGAIRSKYQIDEDIPVFSRERNYIEGLL